MLQAEPNLARIFENNDPQYCGYVQERSAIHSMRGNQGKPVMCTRHGSVNTQGCGGVWKLRKAELHYGLQHSCINPHRSRVDTTRENNFPERLFLKKEIFLPSRLAAITRLIAPSTLSRRIATNFSFSVCLRSFESRIRIRIFSSLLYFFLPVFLPLDLHQLTEVV